MRRDLIVLNIIFSYIDILKYHHFISASCYWFTMLITNKAQYTCHKALIWLRVSLTCCTYVLGEGGGYDIFLWQINISWGGVRKKPLRLSGGGGFKKMKGKNKEIVIAHHLDKLWMLPYCHHHHHHRCHHHQFCVSILSSSIKPWT